MGRLERLSVHQLLAQVLRKRLNKPEQWGRTVDDKNSPGGYTWKDTKLGKEDKRRECTAKVWTGN